MSSQSFYLAHAQDIVGFIAILFSLVHVFDWSRSTNRISFYYNAWMFHCIHKGGTCASECIECSEKLLFLSEIFHIDSNNQTC